MSIKETAEKLDNLIKLARGDDSESPKIIPDNKKYRAFAVILYEDCIEHMQMKEYITDRDYYQYALIKHDKDFWTEEDEEVKNGKNTAGEKKKTHYHLVYKVNTPQTIKSQLNYFRPFIKMIVGVNSLDSYIRYMIHDTPESLNKAQYSILDLEGSYSMINKALCNSSKNISRNLAFISDILSSNGGDLKKVIEEIYIHSDYKADELLETLARFQGLICQLSRSEEKKFERESQEYQIKAKKEQLFYDMISEHILQKEYNKTINKITKGE